MMRLKSEYKVRDMAGEHVVIMQGRLGSDLTRIISLNESAHYLWCELEGKEFNLDVVAELLAERYGIDSEVAMNDAKAWVERLSECGLTE